MVKQIGNSIFLYFIFIFIVLGWRKNIHVQTKLHIVYIGMLQVTSIFEYYN